MYTITSHASSNGMQNIITIEPKKPRKRTRYCVLCRKTNSDGVTLFHFPKDPSVAQRWNEEITKICAWTGHTSLSLVCSDHFHETDLDPSRELRRKMSDLPDKCLPPRRLVKGSVPKLLQEHNAEHSPFAKKRKVDDIAHDAYAQASPSIDHKKSDQSERESKQDHPVHETKRTLHELYEELAKKIAELRSAHGVNAVVVAVDPAGHSSVIGTKRTETFWGTQAFRTNFKDFCLQTTKARTMHVPLDVPIKEEPTTELDASSHALLSSEACGKHALSNETLNSQCFAEQGTHQQKASIDLNTNSVASKDTRNNTAKQLDEPLDTKTKTKAEISNRNWRNTASSTKRNHHNTVSVTNSNDVNLLQTSVEGERIANDHMNISKSFHSKVKIPQLVSNSCPPEQCGTDRALGGKTSREEEMESQSKMVLVRQDANYQIYKVLNESPFLY